VLTPLRDVDASSPLKEAVMEAEVDGTSGCRWDCLQGGHCARSVSASVTVKDCTWVEGAARWFRCNGSYAPWQWRKRTHGAN
jgi:hypothetical protein